MMFTMLRYDLLTSVSLLILWFSIQMSCILYKEQVLDDKSDESASIEDTYNHKSDFSDSSE